MEAKTNDVEYNSLLRERLISLIKSKDDSLNIEMYESLSKDLLLFKEIEGDYYVVIPIIETVKTE